MGMKKLTFICFVLVHLAGKGQVRLASLFTDHMVLQQQAEVSLWGWAGSGERLLIKPSWSEDTIKTKALNSAGWLVKLKTPTAGGPYKILIKGSNQILLEDVMIGEVWLCSGQSNMEWSANNGAEDAKTDMPNANLPQVRLFQVNKSASDFPQIRGEGKWEICTPETMKRFSAVGYFFAKKINSDLKVPIGIINASWGGTPAEVWLPKEMVEADEELKASYALQKEAPWCTSKAGAAYNAMIKPLVPFKFAGVLWYQGESNTVAPTSYKKLMQKLIETWRADFNAQFPFYYVQIAPYAYGRANEGVWMREQQSKLLSVPYTGMVIISDKVDNVNDIHPKFKKPVGERLANFALAEVYKKPILGYKSPIYKSMKIEKSTIRVSFDFAEVGLLSTGGEPQAFMIAGADKKFYPAQAKVDGSTVVVWAKEVKLPVAVRYAWGNTLISNLYNKEFLPVSSFRTDDWELDLSPVGGVKK
jgi:sialate O-acetylesterase